MRTFWLSVVIVSLCTVLGCKRDDAKRHLRLLQSTLPDGAVTQALLKDRYRLLPTLSKTLAHPNKRVRRRSVICVRMLAEWSRSMRKLSASQIRGGKAQKAAIEKGWERLLQMAPVLLKMQKDKNEKVRANVLKTLAVLGAPKKDIVAALQQGLQDPSKRIQLASADALRELKSLDAKTLAPFAAALKDKTSLVKVSLAASLACLKAASPAVKAVLDSTFANAKQPTKIRLLALDGIHCLAKDDPLRIKSFKALKQDTNLRLQKIAKYRYNKQKKTSRW